MNIKFNIDNQNQLQIDFSMSGNEKYYLNNNLIYEHRSASRTGIREFKAEINEQEAQLKIEISCPKLTTESATAKVYLNNELICEDILNDYKNEAALVSAKARKTSLHTLIVFAIVYLAIHLTK